MKHIEVIRVFPAEPQEVWNRLMDYEGWFEWAGFNRSTIEKEGSPQRNGSGAVRCFGSFGVNAYEEVLEFDPPKRMTYRVLKGGLPMKNHLGETIVEPHGCETKVIWRCRFDSKIPCMGGLMRVFVTRFFKKALDGLAVHSFPDR